MLTVRFYSTFKKDTNSTKHPVDSGTTYPSTSYNCEVFEPCTFRNPVFIIRSNSNNTLMKSWSYAYVPDWAACYWVSEKEFMDGQIYVRCEIDPLATYRSDIRSSSQFVLRSASFQDEHIVDLQYPVIKQKQQVSTVLAAASNPFKTNINDGVFVLGITSKAAAAGSSLGSTYYISMTPSQMQSFMGALMNNDSWLNIDPNEISTDLVKVILNPIQYIQSIKFFPLAPSALQSGSLINSLPIGWWSISANHYKAFSGSNQVIKLSFELVVPKHPQANSIGDYLNYEPFSSYKLRLPIVGEVELPSRVGTTDKVEVIYNLDIPSGYATVIVNSLITSPATTYEEATFTTAAAVDIPLAQISKDIVGTVQSAVSTVGSIGSAVGSFLSFNYGGTVAHAANAVNSAIDTAVEAVKPLPAFVGSAGHVGAYKAIEPALYNNYSTVADPDIGLFGSPLCQVKTLSTCSGITVIASPHVEAAGAAKQDLETIETIMATGIRLE